MQHVGGIYVVHGGMVQQPDSLRLSDSDDEAGLGAGRKVTDFQSG
jgi:hypothetical protein